MVHVGDIIETSCSIHRGFQYKSKASINLLPHMNHEITMYSWYPSDVHPRCTYDIPHMNHDIPPMYSGILPMYSKYPQCTEHPGT